MQNPPFDLEKTLREYIANVIHMSLATSKDNRPWVCEVHVAYDEELNLYFRSFASTRHAQELLQNPFVAGNIVEQHQKDQDPRGVYFEGSAELIEMVDEMHPAYIATNERFDLGPEIIEHANMAGGIKFFKITVSDFYIFDVRESDPPAKYHLPWKA